MKFIVLIGDGMADRPCKKLGYRTCLQRAHTPYMDSIASSGVYGRVMTIPPGFAPGSDIAILSIFGYDPARYYSGRAPLEAAARGIRLTSKDVAYRCNLVTLGFNETTDDSPVMEDFSAGHISTVESRILVNEVNRKLSSSKIRFYAGISYRNLMVWSNGENNIRSTPPHDITGMEIKKYLPEGKGAEKLNELMDRATGILRTHPVNRKRMKRGQRPANGIWLWGQGKKPVIPGFKDKYGLKGALVSAVDLVKGLGVYAGFDIKNVRGATGYLDTNYAGKARAALAALNEADIVCVHVEAPDEAGHSGDISAKIKAIEDFDSKVVGTVLKGIKKFKDYSVMVLPDHATPVQVGTHTNEAVPFAIYRSRGAERSAPTHRVRGFSEDIRELKGALDFKKGHALMGYFLKA